MVRDKSRDKNVRRLNYWNMTPTMIDSDSHSLTVVAVRVEIVTALVTVVGDNLVAKQEVDYFGLSCLD